MASLEPDGLREGARVGKALDFRDSTAHFWKAGSWSVFDLKDRRLVSKTAT